MIERKIIIGLITSTEFCKQISSMWDVRLLESATAKRIATWCWEYFTEYNKAPGRDIEAIFYSKIKDLKFPKDIAEEIEQEILPSLSEEYENAEFNLDYLLKDARKYLADRHLTLHHDIVQSLLDEDKTEEAEKLIIEFKPLSVSTSNLDNYIQSVYQIRTNKKVTPPLLFKPWLRSGQITIIYGNYGSGKSLLTIVIAYILGLKDRDDDQCEISTWQVKQSTGTLYIDGELGEQEMEERIRQFEWLGRQAGKYRMRILSIPEYQIATEDQFYLSIRANQLKIINWLKKHIDYKLLVLDSASTLFGLEQENDNSEWNKKINPFLRDLRAIGVACILVHHSGKESKRGFRGASAIGAMAHNIFKLADHSEKAIEKGEAWFNLTKDKQRARGFSFNEFGLRFYQTSNGEETHWKITNMGLD